MIEATDEDGVSSVGFWSIEAFARQVLARPAKPSPVGPTLADAADRLHRKIGVRNGAIDDSMALLASGRAEVIRLAHQPNLFPYEQLLAQSVFLADAVQKLRDAGRAAVAMVFVVDYSPRNRDKKARECAARAFDRVLRTEVRHLHVDLAFDTPTFLAPPPTLDNRRAITDHLRGLARAAHAEPDHLIEMSGVARTMDSLADFNLVSWMNLAIGLWDLPLVFVRLSDIAPDFEQERLDIGNKVWAQPDFASKSLFRYACRNCRRSVASDEKCCDQPDPLGWTIPRVIVDDLSDYALYGVAGGTVYDSSRDHLVKAHRLALRFGIDAPPETCWRLPPEVLQHRDNFTLALTDTGRRLLSDGHNALLEHLIDSERAAAGLDRLRRDIATAMS